MTIDRQQMLQEAADLTRHALDLVGGDGDRPAAVRLLQRALADLRLDEPPSSKIDVPLYLMRMALALLDEQGNALTGCRLQHAIDTYLIG